MSWFYLKEQTKRRYRKGIWLKVESLPKELSRKIYKHVPWFNTIEWIEIKELREDRKVFLQVWTLSLRQVPKIVRKYVVFSLLVDEDPEWVCHGDLGLGLVGQN